MPTSLLNKLSEKDAEAVLRLAAVSVRLRQQTQGARYVKPELRGAAAQLWDSRDSEVIICGPSETGKTYGALSKLNALMWDYPGAQAAIIRKTYASVHGSVLQTFRRILGRDTKVRAYGGEKPEWFDYPNGSRVYVGGMDNPDKVLSSERDVIYINQAEELSKIDYEMLTTRNTGRGAIMPFTQTFGDCNPGGINHWILERQKAGYLKLLYSFHEDNPSLYDKDGNITEQGRRTLGRLDTLSGVLYKRLRLGQWGVPAGVIYDCFDADEHVILPFNIPPEWPRYGGLDFGGVNTAAILVAQEIPKKPPEGSKESKEPPVVIPPRYYVYREYHAGNRTAQQHVTALLEGEPGMPDFSGGSHSEGQWRREFRNAGLFIREPRVKDVEVGIQRGYGIIKRGELRVFNTCTGLIGQLQSYARKLDAMGNTTEEIENKATYHFADAYRYIAIRLADTRRVGQVL